MAQPKKKMKPGPKTALVINQTQETRVLTIAIGPGMPEQNFTMKAGDVAEVPEVYALRVEQDNGTILPSAIDKLCGGGNGRQPWCVPVDSEEGQVALARTKAIDAEFERLRAQAAAAIPHSAPAGPGPGVAKASKGA